MELFILDENQLVQLNHEWIQLHEPFRTLYQRDKGNVELSRKESGRFRKQAHKEFTFIYLYLDYRSRLINYNDTDRYKISIKDAGLPDTWKPDKAVNEAIEKYKELQDCRELRLLKAAYNSVDKIIELLDNTTEINADTVKLLADIRKIINNLEETEKMVKSSLQQAPSARGDVIIGFNED